jgi:hypothetical protein
VLTADGLDDAPLECVGAELGQGPAAVGQADRRGGLLGEAAQLGPLRGGQARRGAAAVAVPEPVQAVPVEGVQVGLDRVGMQREEARDGRGIPTLGVQHDGLGATQEPAVGGGVQQLAELPQLSGSGATSRHGAGHGRPPSGEGPPPIVPRVRWQILTCLM